MNATTSVSSSTMRRTVPTLAQRAAALFPISAPRDLLRNRFLNRGTAFSLEERKGLGLTSFLPPVVETLEEQVSRTWNQLRALGSEPSTAQRLLLAWLLDANVVLYFALCAAHPEAIAAILRAPLERVDVDAAVALRTNGGGGDSLVLCDAADVGQVPRALLGCGLRDVDVVILVGAADSNDTRVLGGASPLQRLATAELLAGRRVVQYVTVGGIHPRRILSVTVLASFDSGRACSQEDESSRPWFVLASAAMEAAGALWPQATFHLEGFTPEQSHLLTTKHPSRRCFDNAVHGFGAAAAAAYLAVTGRFSKAPLCAQRAVFLVDESAEACARTSLVRKYITEAVNAKRQAVAAARLATQPATASPVVATGGSDAPPAREAVAFEFVNADADCFDPTVLTVASGAASSAAVLETVKRLQPTALIWLTAPRVGHVPAAAAATNSVLSQDVVEYMCSYLERPILFALGAGAQPLEARFMDDVHLWSKGRAVCGSIESGRSRLAPTAGVDAGTYVTATRPVTSTACVFAGVVLACSLGQAKVLNDDVFVAAAVRAAEIQSLLFLDGSAASRRQQAQALPNNSGIASAASTTTTTTAAAQSQSDSPLLSPATVSQRDAARSVAVAALRFMQRSSIGGSDLPAAQPDLLRLVRRRMWLPRYDDLGSLLRREAPTLNPVAHPVSTSVDLPKRPRPASSAEPRAAATAATGRDVAANRGVSLRSQSSPSQGASAATPVRVAQSRRVSSTRSVRVSSGPIAARRLPRVAPGSTNDAPSASTVPATANAISTETPVATQ